MKDRYIPGINPSIAKLIYLLNFWGTETYESHAGFYPGDLEEQEYWIQKMAVEEEYNLEVDGPVLLSGVHFQLPGAYILIENIDFNKFKKLLPQYWKLNTVNGHMYRETQTAISYQLNYEHPMFLHFQEVWRNLYFRSKQKFDLDEHNEVKTYSDGIWQNINEFLSSHLPCSLSEFNAVRDQGIQELEKNLLNSIKKFDNARHKRLVDKYIFGLNQ